MIKIVYCLRRKAGMSAEAFHDYWLNTHGPLVRRHAETLAIRRYVQTHTSIGGLTKAMAASRGGASYCSLLPDQNSPAFKPRSNWTLRYVAVWMSNSRNQLMYSLCGIMTDPSLRISKSCSKRSRSRVTRKLNVSPDSNRILGMVNLKT